VCTLSLTIPKPGELADVAEGRYEVVSRKGVIENQMASPDDIWKRRVLALAEGSIIPASEGPYAHNPVVADHFEHGVQQYGYGFPVGMAGM
jgi:CRISPR/Cas system CSM-associated protein Csm4 (group 5 of RAMP superfamily)